MMGKTHIAVGIAAAYLITHPQTAPEFIIATVGGSIGGVMADIDVKIPAISMLQKHQWMLYMVKS